MAARPGSLQTNPAFQSLVMGMERQDVLNTLADSPRGSLRALVVSVDDPEKRGRIKVIFDDFSTKKVQLWGGGEDYGTDREGEKSTSHWIDCVPAFKGLQSKKLVGLRVQVHVTDSQYQYAVLDDVMWDENVVTEKTKPPITSSMTRLPIYEQGDLPPPCEENHGCMVIEENGPMDSDWVCVCLKRDGKYLWVRHADLSHGHAGGNDGTQQVDSLGNRPNPIMMGTIGDDVFPTTAQQFSRKSSYTTKPQGNPKGQRSHWYPPPMSDMKYKEGVNYNMLLPEPNIALNIVRGQAGFPQLNTVIGGFTVPFDPPIPLVVQPKAKSLLQKAQDLLKKFQTLQGIVQNPTKFVKDQAKSLGVGETGVAAFGAGINAATTGNVGGLTSLASGVPTQELSKLASDLAKKSGIPPGTDIVMTGLQSAAGNLKVPSLKSLIPSVSGILGALGVKPPIKVTPSQQPVPLTPEVAESSIDEQIQQQQSTR